MTRYQKLQQERRNKNQKPTKEKKSILYRIVTFLEVSIIVTALVLILMAYLENKITPTETVTLNKEFDLTKHKWKPTQIKNLLIVQDATNYVNHPNPRRVGAHLLSESSGNVVVDGDIVNGAFKKSYGIMQVKLGTVYYVNNKRPDLIKLYASEVNSLPKEDILDKLRKDPFFNAKMGALTHIVLIDVCGDPNKASVAYNRGVCKADQQGTDYLNKILKYEEML